MPEAITVILQLKDTLNARALKQVRTSLKERAIPAFRSTLLGLNPENYPGLTDTNAKVLRERISLSGKTIQQTPDGVRINLSVDKKTSNDPIGEWAYKIHIGGVIQVKDSSKFMAIPFNKGPYHIVDYAAKSTNYNHRVGDFVKEMVAKSPDGKYKLRYKERGDGLVMSGKIAGGKWEPIAFLTKKVNVKATGWVTKFLYNTLRAVEKTND